MSTSEFAFPAPGFGFGLSVRDYLIAHAPITLQDAVIASGYSFSDYRSALSNDEHRRTIMAILALLRREYADAVMADMAEKPTGYDDGLEAGAKAMRLAAANKVKLTGYGYAGLREGTILDRLAQSIMDIGVEDLPYER